MFLRRSRQQPDSEPQRSYEALSLNAIARSGGPTRQISEELWEFIDEMPYERRSILAFVRGAADSLAPGAVVLDVGAGKAPYRELFAHCEYITTDWGQSVHERSRDVDFIAPAQALPMDDGAVDAVLLTQVLEHIADPADVLDECARVLGANGGVFVTVPFVWELHELPFDYWRFTPASLEQLLTRAGFVDVIVKPRNDCFSTVAQLLRNLRWAMGREPDGRDGERNDAADLLDQLAGRISQLAPLDVNGSLPLGWTASARRGEGAGGR